jgi:transposase-like protein
MLSDKPSRVAVKSNRRRSVKSTNKHWSDSQKIEAVTTFLALGGSPSKTCEILQIPLQTLQSWRKAEWWHRIEQDIQKEEKLTLSYNLKQVIDKSIHLIADRLENGDWIYDNKTGKLLRKPVPMKDAARVASDMIDKRLKIADSETFTIAQENIQDKLNQLAKSFSELATKKPVLLAQDVEFIEKVEG